MHQDPVNEAVGEPGQGEVDIGRVSAASLFDGRTEVIVEHNGQDYRLRITSKGKLILTK